MRQRHHILPFVLKQKWFDLIASGVKDEEYRDVTPFYFARLDRYLTQPPKYIRFYLGFARNRPMIQVECIKITITYGKPALGAAPNEPYYVIKFKPYKYGKH